MRLNKTLDEILSGLRKPMRLFITLSILLLCASCVHPASSATKIGATPWIDDSIRTSVPREELAAIAAAAAQAPNLIVVGMTKEGEDTIRVCIAKSTTDRGGVAFFYKKTASGWVEGTNLISMWNYTKLPPPVEPRRRM